MPPAPNAPPESLSLLPTVLQHLPTLLSKPSLASQVFLAIRKSSQSPPPHLTPLLPPLTILTLNATSPTLRCDATATCLSLLRALANSNFSPLAAAYVEDLVHLAHSLLHHSHPHPLHPPFYAFSSTASNHPSITLPITPLSTLNLPPVPVSPLSLQSLLYLLASLVPASDPPVFPNVPSTYTYTPFPPTDDLTATTLWVSIGSASRTAVLDLSANFLLLSTRCGPELAIPALTILQRACGIPAAAALPYTTLTRLQYVLDDVLLRESVSGPVRTQLYILARMVQSDACLSARLWIAAGLRDAVRDDGRLGHMLRTWSRHGDVQVAHDVEIRCCERQQSLRGARAACEARDVEPARKKRRVAEDASGENATGDSAIEEALSSQGAMFPGGTGQWPRTPVEALTREVCELGTIERCVEDVEGMKILVRVVAIMVDMLQGVRRVGREGGTERSDKFAEWVKFVHSITVIVRDVCASLEKGKGVGIWTWVVDLARECLRLVALFDDMKSACKASDCKEEQFPVADIEQDSEGLRGSAVAVAAFLSEKIGTDDNKCVEYLGKAGSLLWDIGECNRRQEANDEDRDIMIEFAEKFRKCVLGHPVPRNDKVWSSLIKGVIHLESSLVKDDEEILPWESIDELKGIVQENKLESPRRAAAALNAISDVINSKLRCPGNATGKVAASDSKNCVVSHLDVRIWTSVFKEVETIVKGAGTDDLISAATQCLGALLIHAPRSKGGEASSVMVKTLWHPTCEQARKLVVDTALKILTLRVEDQRSISRGERSPLVPAASHVDFVETWDDIHVDAQYRADLQGFFRLLALELDEKLKKWTSALRSEDIHEIEKLDPSPLAMILSVDGNEFLKSKIAGLAARSLVSSSIFELNSWRSSLFKYATFSGSEAISSASRGILKLKVWSSFVLHVLNNADDLSGSAVQKVSAVRRIQSQEHPQSDSCFLPGRSPPAAAIACFLSSRMSGWLPWMLNDVLASKSFAQHISKLLTLPSQESLWRKVSRHTAIRLLQNGDAVTLDSLAQRIGESSKVLVEQVSADALARAILAQPQGLDLSPEGPNALLFRCLEAPVADIIERRAGKIVQRIVMEIGSNKDAQARQALSSLSRIVQVKSRRVGSGADLAGSLVSTHFMLVMDAVNRGMFHSKATRKERVRFIRMLDGVLHLSQAHLHLFVPKILATLKMALDVDPESEVFRAEVLLVWRNFLASLGAKRALPHLSSVLAILLPFIPSHEDLLVPLIANLVENSSQLCLGKHSEIIFLLRIVDHPSLRKITQGFVDSDENAPLVAEKEGVLQNSSTAKLVQACEDMSKIISQHENGVTEVLAAGHFLDVLRSHREDLDEYMKVYSGSTLVDENTAIGDIARLLGRLVLTLNKSKNIDCQEKLMQCIGEIGALDPAIVQKVNNDSKPEHLNVMNKKLSFNCAIQSLASVLLEDHLVPALARGSQREGPNNNLNRYGLVIQELLRVCGCRRETAARASKTTRIRNPRDPPIDWDGLLVGETVEENGIVFWENLDSTTRTVAEPYLAEPFDVQHYKAIFGGSSAGNVQLACQPVWSKVKAATPKGVAASAQEWRRQLVVQMVDYIGKQGKFGEILKALRPILRYDDSIASYVFPFAVTAALDLQRRVEGTEIQDFLVREFSVVLRQSSSPQPVFDLFDSLRKWREERCRIRGLVQFRSQRAVHGIPPGAKRRLMAEMSIQKERDLDSLSPLVDMDGKEAPDLSLLVQANAAFASRSYARTVMLAESYIRNLRSAKGASNWPAVIPNLRGSEERGETLDRNSELEALDLLQKAFAELEDSDSMAGIASLKINPSMEDQMIDAEVAGRHDSALVIYERAIAKNPRSASMHEGFLRCLMTLGHWETMLSHTEGLLWSATLEDIELRECSQTLGIDAAWRLGRWDIVEELSRNSGCDQGGQRSEVQTSLKLDFNAGFGKMLIWLKDRSLAPLCSKATEIRKKMLIPLSQLAREGYDRAYPIVVLLQMLADVEDTARMPQFRNDGRMVWSHRDELVPLICLEGRERATSPSLRIKEPILSTKRICFEQAGRFNQAAAVNLRLAKLAHDADNLRAASAYAFQASSTPLLDSGILNDSVIRQAKITHAQGDASAALLTVKAEIARLLEIKEGSGQGNESDSSLLERLSTAYLLAGKWIEETKSEPSKDILDYFQRSTNFGHSEVEPFYALGRHFDTLLQAGANATSDAVLATDGKSSRRGINSSAGTNNFSQVVHYVPMVIKSFAQALCQGHSRIFEALPRMLTVWFDYHSTVHCPDEKLSGSPVEDSVAREMKKAFKSIPLYMWMTAIPQLMSRLLHPRRQVADELSQLLSRVFVAYPDQCIWLVLPSSLLQSESRKKATKLIVSFVNQGNRKTKRGALACANMTAEQTRALHSKVVAAYNVLQRFVDICVTLVPKEKRGRMDNCRNEFLGLRNLLEKSSPGGNPIVPTLETLTAKLPRGSSSAGHRAFSQEAPVIVDIDDNALVLSSMMRPRRISLLGSDGRQYRFLAKKETAGDMRKDSRLMEFVTVVNRLLSKDSSSCRRELELKTYAVLPLTEEAGMLEWVNDLDPMRKLVREQQVGVANLPDTGTIQKKYTSMSDKKRFLEWAMEQCPPMLDRFFMQQFGGGANPEAWLKARNVWTRSVAGWSMAGYIVGLGDRHGENVLIERTTGRCVHVDFAMLFDKGRTLRVPEIIPFRLTPNMVTAMGIAGYEGSYRLVSEVVMGVMRRNADALLGVLETFLHDPLADWGKGETRSANGTIVANKEAWQTRAAVKAKLTGMVDNSGLTLSIKGQVERLIHEATSLENLSKMYIWWSGWI